MKHKINQILKKKNKNSINDIEIISEQTKEYVEALDSNRIKRRKIESPEVTFAHQSSYLLSEFTWQALLELFQDIFNQSSYLNPDLNITLPPSAISDVNVSYNSNNVSSVLINPMEEDSQDPTTITLDVAENPTSTTSNTTTTTTQIPSKNTSRQSLRVKEKEKRDSEESPESEMESFLSQFVSMDTTDKSENNTTDKPDSTETSVASITKSSKKKNTEERQHVIDFVQQLDMKQGYLSMLDRLFSHISAKVYYCWTRVFIDNLLSFFEKVKTYLPPTSDYRLTFAELNLDLALKKDSITLRMSCIEDLLFVLYPNYYSQDLIFQIRYLWLNARYNALLQKLNLALSYFNELITLISSQRECMVSLVYCSQDNLINKDTVTTKIHSLRSKSITENAKELYHSSKYEEYILLLEPYISTHKSLASIDSNFDLTNYLIDSYSHTGQIPSMINTIVILLNQSYQDNSKIVHSSLLSIINCLKDNASQFDSTIVNNLLAVLVKIIVKYGVKDYDTSIALNCCSLFYSLVKYYSNPPCSSQQLCSLLAHLHTIASVEDHCLFNKAQLIRYYLDEYSNINDPSEDLRTEQAQAFYCLFSIRPTKYNYQEHVHPRASIKNEERPMIIKVIRYLYDNLGGISRITGEKIIQNIIKVPRDIHQVSVNQVENYLTKNTTTEIKDPLEDSTDEISTIIYYLNIKYGAETNKIRSNIENKPSETMECALDIIKWIKYDLYCNIPSKQKPDSWLLLGQSYKALADAMLDSNLNSVKVFPEENVPLSRIIQYSLQCFYKCIDTSELSPTLYEDIINILVLKSSNYKITRKFEINFIFF